jgi:hypothetical protein
VTPPARVVEPLGHPQSCLRCASTVRLSVALPVEGDGSRQPQHCANRKHGRQRDENSQNPTIHFGARRSLGPSRRTIVGTASRLSLKAAEWFQVGFSTRGRVVAGTFTPKVLLLCRNCPRSRRSAGLGGSGRWRAGRGHGHASAGSSLRTSGQRRPTCVVRFIRYSCCDISGRCRDAATQRRSEGPARCAARPVLRVHLVDERNPPLA